MKLILTTAVALVAVAATLACTGCGGGDPAMPTLMHQAGAPGKKAWVLIHMDAAEGEDIAGAMDSFRHAYQVVPQGWLMATDEASASTARLILVDALGTEAFDMRVVR